MAQKPDTRGYYDAFASMHDRYATMADWPAKLDKLVGLAVGLKQPGTVDAALDLGAGTGMSVAAVKRHVRPARMVAVDTSPKMLEELRAGDMSDDVETVVADVRDYVAACGETFDLITSMSALEFVPDLPGLLRNMGRLLNDNGIFAATYVPKTSDARSVVHESPGIGQAIEEFYWEPGEVEGSLTSSGLTIVGRDDTPAYTANDVRVGAYNFVVAAKQG